MPDRFVVSPASRESISIVPVVANVRFVAVKRAISAESTVIPAPVSSARLISAPSVTVTETSAAVRVFDKVRSFASITTFRPVDVRVPLIVRSPVPSLFSSASKVKVPSSAVTA